ncbi:hypothetical protein [Pseudomonas sp. NPDC089401]|uniref:hypothetical protein n=1 Tax=Pseudomonas sp. NPDC089401 TaxID=3364462 RepID=UPI003824CA31
MPLDNFTIHGTEAGTDKTLDLDEISLLASPDTLQSLGEFFIESAKKMKTDDMDHIHLQDALKTFSHGKHVDIILLNNTIIKPNKT